MKLVWTNPRACFGTHIEAAPICVADNYPGQHPLNGGDLFGHT